MCRMNTSCSLDISTLFTYSILISKKKYGRIKRYNAAQPSVAFYTG